MINGKRVIVSMTSWTKRINNVSHTAYSMFTQTVKPDSIELNLAVEEFPNKENDLPKDLKLLIETGIITLNWVEKNTKVFKKFIPVIKKYQGEDYYLIAADDDWIYSPNYIKVMIESLNTASYFCLNNDNIHGAFTIYNSMIFGNDYCDNVNDDMIRFNISDYYTEKYIKMKNGKMSSSKHLPLNKYVKSFNPVFPNSGNTKNLIAGYDKQRVLAAYKIIDEVLQRMK